MKPLTFLAQQYELCQRIMETGVGVIHVVDEVGANLQRIIRELIGEMGPNPSHKTEDFLASSRALTWKRITQPQPIESNPDTQLLIDQLLLECDELGGAFVSKGLIDELSEVVKAIRAGDAPLAKEVLHESLYANSCEVTVMGASGPAFKGITGWLEPMKVPTTMYTRLQSLDASLDSLLAIGPPRFFPSALTTVPPAHDITFVVPSWFKDVAIRTSSISTYAQQAIRVTARVEVRGVAKPALRSTLPEGSTEVFLPEPSFGSHHEGLANPYEEEVPARKVLLRGDYAIWMDDGERIKTIDPSQPAGERIRYSEVQSVERGTYLLLRPGESEAGALYDVAIGILADKRSEVEAAQQHWKACLAQRISEIGIGPARDQLRQKGVKAFSRVNFWSNSDLIRPSDDADFRILLEWLEIPTEPTFAYATDLRRAHHQASTYLREGLEEALSNSDLSALEEDGFIHLAFEQGGLRGLIAARVLAIAPTQNLVPRPSLRVPFEDRGGHWLE